MPSLALIMPLIGASIAMLIGMMIFGSIDQTIDCEAIQASQYKEQCENAKDNAWTVIGILPVALFFLLFVVMGGMFDFKMPKLPKLSHGTGRNKTQKVTISQKIMLYLGLAKVKKIQ